MAGNGRSMVPGAGIERDDPRMSSARRAAALLAVAAGLLLLTGAGCGGGGDGAQSSDASAAGAGGSVSAEHDVTGIAGWLNGGPTTIADELAAGRVVLVDFWTYTCVNCIRTFPHLRAWQEKYAGKGLTILGIHSPEFEFEKDAANVRDALERHGITWVVAQDNEMKTWREFNNRFWPAKYLFDSRGEIAYQHFGEGSYAETEEAIREQLAAVGADLSDVPFEPLAEAVRDPDAVRQTREIYGGYSRAYTDTGLYAGQQAYYEGADKERFYEDNGGSRREGQYYLQGLWRNEEEAIVHARRTEELEDYIALDFAARSVNVVINPAGPEPFDVVVELNRQPLTREQAGADMTFDAHGRSVLRVEGGRMYALLELPEFKQAELRLLSDSDDFAVFAFTFGTYTEGA